MLVIVSDLHLADGSTGPSISPGAFHLFAERLADLAVRASSRADGSYRPIERIDVLLLGDTLDFIRSSRWIQQSARPWGDLSDPELLETVTRITADILRHNSEALAVLRWIAEEGAVRVPSANLRQSAGGEGQPVPVRIHYMVGNCDWLLNVKGRALDGLRQSVIQHLGLANAPDQPFPHDPRESEELLDLLRRHKTFARHGDLFDPWCFEEERSASSVSDVIAIELVARFAYRVEHELAGDLLPELIVALRDIDSVRPLLGVPAWLRSVLERRCESLPVRKQIRRIWDELVAQLIEHPVIRNRPGWPRQSLVDRLEQILPLSGSSRSTATETSRQQPPWAATSLVEHALSEQEFRNRRARHIVYGHTHLHESVPLESSSAEGYVLNQIYFNAGTWRRTYRPAALVSQWPEFVPVDALSYVAFFQGDERSGRPYETWSGSLGRQPSETTLYRIDSVDRARKGQLQTPTARFAPRPHFVSPVTRASVVPTRRS